ncbi:MAG: hypothetical protein CFE49_03865 [Pseudomonas sp. PGPPP3]|nr:MAG: hypothetical protein CFE49_03865 [Pseudomonas sp. PGPPP3]
MSAVLVTPPLAERPRQAADTRGGVRAATPAAPRPAVAASRAGLLLQRRCACGGEAGLAGECEACSAQRFSLQRRTHADRSDSQDAAQPALPDSVGHTLASPGRPLEADARTFMEGRFGLPLGDVRIHDDSAAAASARDVQAQAYTVGQHIVFDHGRYRPDTEAGRHLLAHELAHTVQQQGLQRTGTSTLVDHGPVYRQLEADAERMADAVMQGGPGGVALAAPALTLSRASKAPPTAGGGSARAEPSVPITVASDELGPLSFSVRPDGATGPAAAAKLRRFRVDPFYLPGVKGPRALQVYEQRAAANSLQAVLQITGEFAQRTALWQKRDAPATLGDSWVRAVRWTPADQDTNWQALAGKSAFPKVGTTTCNIDHIVELQLGGGNDPANMQALDPEPNQLAGRVIWNQMQQLGTAVAQKFAVGDADQLQLVFGSVKQAGAVEPDEGKPNAPRSCLMIDTAARRGVERRAVLDAQGQKARAVRLAAAGSANDFVVPDNWGAKAKNATLFDEPANKSAAQMVSSLVLETLHFGTAKSATVTARWDPRSGRRGTRLPLTVDAQRGSTVTMDAKHEGDVGGVPQFKLGFSSKPVNIGFTYPFLSPGQLTKLSMTEAGEVDWAGHITPSVPFLGRLDVAYEQGELKVTKGLDPKSIKSPLPGVSLTRAEVSIVLAPEFKPEGTLALRAGPEKKPLADGVLKLSRDDAGLVVQGDLRLHVPGVDESLVRVTYRSGAWSGELTIQSTQIKVPYVESGSLTVRVHPQSGVTADGRLQLGLPGGNKAEVGLQRSGERWVFSGSGTFKIPKLDDTTVSVLYDGETLVAKGKTGFSFHSLRGTLDPVTYVAKKGEADRISGTGKLEVNKGRVSGNMTVNLLPSGRFTGQGTVTVRITDKLSAKAGLVVDEQEKVRLSGELRLELVELFKGVQGEKNLFEIEKNIPIPGASIPGIGGLMAKVGGGVDIGYGVGPGVLRNVFIEAAFNPLEDNPDLDVGMGGRLEIPAYARLKGYIKGGVALDVTVAEVSGFLTVSVALTMNGGLAAEFKGRYAKNRFVVDAHAEVFAALVLGLGLDATVRAKALVLGEKSKTWALKHLDVPTGLDFKLRAPIHYASDEPFKAPSLDSIEFSPPPKIDPGDLLGRIFAAANASEA